MGQLNSKEDEAQAASNSDDPVKPFNFNFDITMKIKSSMSQLSNRKNNL
jgi:hypothetical protein